MEQLYVELLKINNHLHMVYRGLPRLFEAFTSAGGCLFIMRIKSPKGAIVAGFEVIYLDNSVNIRL